MSAWQASLDELEMRRNLDDEEFEDDGFSFDDDDEEDEEDEELDEDEDDLDEEDEDDLDDIDDDDDR